MNTLVTIFSILGFSVESGNIKYKYDDTRAFSLEKYQSNAFLMEHVKIVRPIVYFDTFLTKQKA